MSENLLSGWSLRPLASLASYENGFAFNDQHWSEEGLPIIRIAQITGSQGIVDRYPGKLPEKFSLKSGDMIFSWSGTLAVVKWHGGPAWLNQHLFKVTPTASIDEGFLFHVLSESVAEFDKRAHGSTMKHIKRGELAEHSVAVPDDPNEQSKIAEILDTLDEAIRGTKAVVAKLKAMKQGLLQDLLTRGIDDNGDLRPPQPEAPHLYKHTPLDWLPEEWDYSTLGSVIAKIDSGWSPACIETPPTAGEWGVLKVSAITRGLYDDKQSKTLPPGMKPRPVLEVRNGDVILTRANGVAELVGKTVQAQNTQEKLMLSDKLLRLVPDTRKMTKDFLAILMTSDTIVRQIEKSMSGSSGQKNISQAQIRSFACFVPSVNEQEEIATRIAAFEARVAAEEKVLAKLRLQKSGLMDDLLTGRTPVRALL